MKLMLFMICVVTALVVAAAGLVWYLSATTEMSR